VKSGLLFAMVFVREMWFVIPMYVFRTAFMNATTPIERSIMMDTVSMSRQPQSNLSCFSNSVAGDQAIVGL
jgi:hypothetical protein